MVGACSCVWRIVVTTGVEASRVGGLRVEWQCAVIGIAWLCISVQGLVSLVVPLSSSSPT